MFDPNAERAAAYLRDPSLRGPLAAGGGDPNEARAAAYARDPSLRGPGGGGGGGFVDPNAARAAAYAKDPSLMGPGASLGANLGSTVTNNPFDPNAARAAAYAKNPSLMGTGADTRNNAALYPDRGFVQPGSRDYGLAPALRDNPTLYPQEWWLAQQNPGTGGYGQANAGIGPGHGNVGQAPGLGVSAGLGPGMGSSY